MSERTGVDPDLEGRRAAARGLAVTATVLLVGLVLAGLAQLGSTVAPGLAGDRLASYQGLWPQGWSFFTGLADKDVIMAYPVGSDGVSSTALTQRKSWTDRAAGLDRAGEAGNFELYQLAGRIPDQYWHDCDRVEPSGCVTRSAIDHPFRVPRGSLKVGPCGLIAIADTRPVTVTGGELPADPRRIDKIAVVDLACAA